GNNSGENSSSTSDSPETSVDPQTQALIDAFALDSFTAPDGSTFNKSEAVYAAASEDGSTYAIGFDFSYMRYAEPLFDSTFDNPNLIDWDTLEFNTDIGFLVENTNYFKVKAGDTLENGLTVESAQYWINSAGEMFSSEIVLSGELALEGILYCVAENPEYVDEQGDLMFFADSTKSSFVPMPNSSVDFTEKWTDTSDNFAAVFDGKRIHFGNINDVSVDLSDTFRNSSYVEAKITMKGVRVMYTENGGGFVYAEPVDVEVIG
ncbi:MAG: hypothetical protein J1E36_07620, partial [Eubacterium sp.]|nr:hypothetical protein [Eubacterium sp.]